MKIQLICTAAALVSVAYGAELTLQVPPLGTHRPIRGKLHDIDRSGFYSALCYIQTKDRTWWGPKGGRVEMANGEFVVERWANSIGDTVAPVIACGVLPSAALAATTLPPVLGTAAIPDAITSQAIAWAEVHREMAAPEEEKQQVYGSQTLDSEPAQAPARATASPRTHATVPAAPQPEEGELIPPEEAADIVSPHTTRPTTVTAPIASPQPQPPPRKLAVTSDKSLNFAGRQWYVKDSKGGKALPGPCVWDPSPSRIWADGNGLHLTVAPASAGCDGWASTEAWLTEPLGFGTYLFRITGPVASQDKEVTFGLFIWDDDCPGNCWHREIDFEIGKWGNDADSNNIQFVVQPYTEATNLRRLDISRGSSKSGSGAGAGGCNDAGADGFSGAAIQQTTLVMEWYSRMVRFYVFDGHFDLNRVKGAGGKLLGSWAFPYPDRLPQDAGGARVHLNLWQANWGGVPSRNRRVHQVVNGFEFTSAWTDLGKSVPLQGRLLQQQGAGESGASAAPVVPGNGDSALSADQRKRMQSLGDPEGAAKRRLAAGVSQAASDTVGTGTGTERGVKLSSWPLVSVGVGLVSVGGLLLAAVAVGRRKAEAAVRRGEATAASYGDDGYQSFVLTTAKRVTNVLMPSSSSGKGSRQAPEGGEALLRATRPQLSVEEQEEQGSDAGSGHKVRSRTGSTSVSGHHTSPATRRGGAAGGGRVAPEAH